MEPQPVDAWARGSSAAQLAAGVASPGVALLRAFRARPGVVSLHGGLDSEEEGTATDRLRAARFLAQQSQGDDEATLRRIRQLQQQPQQDIGRWQDGWRMPGWREVDNIPSTVSTAERLFDLSVTEGLHDDPTAARAMVAPPRQLLAPSSEAHVAFGERELSGPAFIASEGQTNEGRIHEAMEQQLLQLTPQLQELQDGAARYAHQRRGSTAAPAPALDAPPRSRCLSWTSRNCRFTWDTFTQLFSQRTTVKEAAAAEGRTQIGFDCGGSATRSG